MTADNRGPQLLAVCSALLAITVISIGLRLYSRLVIIKAFGVDDWLMSVATLSFILYVSSAITGVHYGTGQHTSNLSADQIFEAKKFWWLCYIWYSVTMTLSKLSIAIFLLRITVQRIHRYIIVVALVFSVLSGLIFLLITMLQCKPISYFWDQNQDGSCLSTEIIIILVYIYSSFSMVCDFTFALLPVDLLRGLQMKKEVKMSLIPILSMGCVASVAVVVRFGYIKDFKDPDFLWSTLDIAIWSTVEQGLAITAGSLATLQPLLKTIGHRLGLLSSGSPSSAAAGGRHTTGGLATSGGKASNLEGPNYYGTSFAMATFNRPDENDIEDDDDDSLSSANEKKPAAAVVVQARGDRGNHITYTRTVTVTSSNNARGPIWAANPDGRRNESEEELTIKPSSENLSGENKVTTKSFLPSERVERRNNSSSYL
ncbi:hypothetical protein BX600DRAFT_537877 [Xylariales sp. PMI_506]|nr:hypothetical protein BX600DRAFT_537877 [Xylariales sp. PMI_506]